MQGLVGLIRQAGVLGQLSPAEQRRAALRQSRAGYDLSEGDKARLEKRLEALHMLDRFDRDFRDPYADNLIPLTGEIENYISRRPGLMRYVNPRGNPRGFVTPGQGAWWSDYAALRNQIRHEKFGGQLTEHESREFMKQDIDPSVGPGEIRRKLAAELEAVLGGLGRQVDSLVEMGAEPEVLRRSVGDDFWQMLDDDRRRRAADRDKVTRQRRERWEGRRKGGGQP